MHGQFWDVAKISLRMHQYIIAAGIEFFKDWFSFAIRDFDGRLHPAANLE